MTHVGAAFFRYLPLLLLAALWEGANSLWDHFGNGASAAKQCARELARNG